MPMPTHSTDTSYLGYLEVYIKLYFTDGESATVKYTGDFRNPESIQEFMDMLPQTVSCFYREQFGKTLDHWIYVSREEYENEDPDPNATTVDFDDNSLKINGKEINHHA